LFALSYSEAKDEEEDDDAVSVVVAVAGLNADINYMFAYSTYISIFKRLNQFNFKIYKVNQKCLIVDDDIISY
jgi:hypothetical protein